MKIMLFIWDLHISSNKKEEIIAKLRETIENSSEKNIIFLGDFVYHFSFDRSAISMLFNLILDFVKKWKNIYVIAGNHDWINNHFIFEEVEKILTLTESKNLHIMSSSTVHKIENKNILFLPFHYKNCSIEDIEKTENKLKKIKDSKIKTTLHNILLEVREMQKSDNKNTNISATINLELVDKLISKKIDIIVHHFYIAKTKFTGQKAIFSYKHIALTDLIFQLPIQIISGHLHNAFRYKNYSCVGSFWNTTSLEENEIKSVLTINWDKEEFQAIIMNPYIVVNYENEEKIGKKDIDKALQTAIKESETNIGAKLDIKDTDYKKINLVIKSKEFANIKDIVDGTILEKVGEIKQRKYSNKSVQEIMDKLKIDKEELSSSFNAWKDLAKDYIITKYPEEHKEYLKILEDLKIF